MGLQSFPGCWGAPPPANTGLPCFHDRSCAFSAWGAVPGADCWAHLHFNHKTLIFPPIVFQMDLVPKLKSIFSGFSVEECITAVHNLATWLYDVLCITAPRHLHKEKAWSQANRENACTSSISQQCRLMMIIPRTPYVTSMITSPD